MKVSYSCVYVTVYIHVYYFLLSLLHTPDLIHVHAAQAVFSVSASITGYSQNAADWVAFILPLSSCRFPRAPLTFDNYISFGVKTHLTRFAQTFILEQLVLLTSNKLMLLRFSVGVITSWRRMALVDMLIVCSIVGIVGIVELLFLVYVTLL